MKVKTLLLVLLHLLLAKHAQQSSSFLTPAISDISHDTKIERSGPNDVLGNEVERFETKHIYNPSQHDYFQNSYDLIAYSPGMAERFLVEMNLQLYEGGILPRITVSQADLPPESDQLKDRILEQLKSFNDPDKAVSVVDTKTETIVADIRDDFNKWKNDPEFNTYFDNNRNSKLFITNNEYTLTQITYEADGEFLVLKARKLQSRIEVGVNKDGIPKHFERPVSALDADKLEVVGKEVARIGKNSLLEIAIKTRKFWNVFKTVTSNNMIRNSGVINRKQSMYEEYHDEIFGAAMCSLSGRRKRSTATACAIDLDVNGKVKDIHSEKFMEDYIFANERMKQEMLDAVVKNPDKVAAGTEEDSKVLLNLVEREQVRQHHEKIQDLKDIQLPTRQPSSDPDKVVGDFLDFEAKIKDLGTDVKLSPHKTSEKLKSLTSSDDFKTSLKHGASIASGVIGIGFMAKTIATGIIHDDTTSLAIVGAQVGYEVVTTAVDITSHFLKDATKAGKAAKKIGEVAGPIGDIADIGLSVWSLVKSVQALRNADNKYDRNAAIVDIVTTSIDIVVTATLAVLSIVFAPFAPFFALAGVVINFLMQLATALFNAKNEVARINSEIPLHGFEKRNVFESRFFDIFGTRKPDYIDYLVAEKKANDAVVKSFAKFLEDNQDFRGIVFPSMTFAASGKCELWKRHCRARMVGGRCLAGQWEGWERLATKCEWNRPCGGLVCNYFTKDTARTGRNHYECRNCGAGPDMKFDSPRSNSIVDFRNTQNVYLERAVPSNVQNAVFQCKPGSKTNRGYTVSQDKATRGYFCENAIGILQPTHKQKPGQIMLFKLEDGDDQIYLKNTFVYPSYPNLFLMGNQGNKIYEGGYDRNDFVFSSNCTTNLRGRIKGGPKSDSITIGEFCAKNKRITMDFKQGILRSQDGKLSLSVSQIEQLIGREKQGESIYAACLTRSIISRGGSSSLRDEIQIPDDSFCSYDVTVLATDYTTITSRARKGKVVIPISGTPTGMQINLDMYAKSALSTTIVYLNVSSSQARLSRFTNLTNQLELRVTAKNYESTFQFYFKSGAEKAVSLYFTELPDPSPMSILYATLAGEKMFYHTLPKMTKVMSRTGNPSTENVFEISGDTWTATGGSKNDEFILNTVLRGTLNGGLGTDTLRFHQNFKQSTTIDLQSHRFLGIENIIGKPLLPIFVVTACDTELVSTQGGSQATPDTVTVKSLTCSSQKQMRTQILANGHVRVLVEGKISGNDSLSVVVDGTSSDVPKFSLVTKNHQTDNLFVNIFLNHTNLDITNISWNTNLQIVTYQILGNRQEKMEFSLKQDPIATDSPYINSPFIQISSKNSKPGIFMIDRATMVPQVYFEIGENEAAANLSIQGISKIKNVFRLSTSQNCSWTATGGEKNDMFMLAPRKHHANNFRIDGFKGENTLLLETHEEDSNVVMEMDFVKQAIGYLPGLSVGEVKNIHHVVGRANAPDVINPSCTTKSIAGRGGRDKNLTDQIIINDGNKSNCVMGFTTVVDHFTQVENNATTGNFIYVVNDLTTSEIKLNATTNSSHYLQFSFYPWSQIDEIRFDQNTEELIWKSKSGHEETTHLFRMSKTASMQDYNNPTFHFSPTDAQISSEIQVGGNGLLYSTVTVNENHYPEKVEALPVHLNRFIVNITQNENNTQAGGVIEGCSDNDRCLANQFFLVNMVNTTISVLDGGACRDKSCTNYLHFSDNLKHGTAMLVDLDSCSGFVQTNTGHDIISRLQNIHEFHGTKHTTTLVGCDTRQISGVKEIVLKDRHCSDVDLIIGLENNTTVRFEPTDTEKGKKGRIHYRFTQVVNFDPEGDLEHMQNYNHNYYFTFALTHLTSLRFDHQNHSLFYNLNGTEFHHKMLTSPQELNQFYSQPGMLTADGFRLQVSRNNSLWVTLGDTSREFTSSNIPEFEKLARRLGVTMVIETRTQFFFIGNLAEDERSALQNMVNTTSYLVANGAQDAIIEIVSLDHDIILYTGFTEEDYNNWANQGYKLKQTIDFTDIIIPIRAATQSKYVPKVRISNHDLIISLPEFPKSFPAKLVIVNGTKPWVANRLQLLLSTTLMDLKLINDPTNTNNSRWEIVPRPLVIPESISIYDISAEDLEDNQEIKLESTVRQRSVSTASFMPAKDGEDLVLTNIGSMGVLEKKTLLISDFFETTGNNSLRNKRSLTLGSEANITELAAPKSFQNVKVSLPGLSLLLSDSEVKNSGKSRTNLGFDFNNLNSLESLLHETDKKLQSKNGDIASGLK